MPLLDSSSEVMYLTVCREYSDSASTTKQRTEQNMKGSGRNFLTIMSLSPWGSVSTGRGV